ncbi:hypothetical protein [Hymenobacter coalescens]
MLVEVHAAFFEVHVTAVEAYEAFFEVLVSSIPVLATSVHALPRSTIDS